MKKVRITIGALTRVEYTTTVEVPDDADDDAIREMADEIYDSTDGGEFQDDPNFWERGETSWEIEDDESGEAA